MELIRGIHNIRERHKGCVLTIGKFDGVHLGHRAVLTNLIAQAQRQRLPTTVMVFEPQPEEVFNAAAAPARLSRLRDKYLAFKRLGIDRLLCVKFDRKFADMSPQAFIDDLLVTALGVRYLVVGDDFRFGQGRRGDYALLQQASQQQDFTLSSTQSFRLATNRISSSLIRQTLAQGDFCAAEQMLGRPFSIAGKVVHGEKRGRQLGFPTANILLKRCKSPLHGVYAVKVRVDQNVYAGVANIGHRPTVSGQRAQLEVHLFDFNGNLYGQFIEVEIHAGIRAEKKFASLEQLQTQITQDATAARALLG